jgi:hypothetical protein
MGFVNQFFWVSVCLFLGACSSGMRAGLLTIQQEVLHSNQTVRQTQLQSGYRYLLIEHNGHEALLVWVSQEPGPLGDTSVWVSADGVIFRLAQGRLVGVSEPLRNWSLTSEVPSLTMRQSALYPTPFVQTSDRQPGFRLGTVHHLIRRPGNPQAHFMAWVEGGQKLRWVEDVDAGSGQQLALYAINLNDQIIAGHRCISPEWCYSWQGWPSTNSAKSS